ENDYFLKSDFTRFTQFFLIRAGTSADDILNAGEKRWLSIEAGLLLRAHGLRYPTRSLMP
ncbi:hypothetical protein C0R72_23315, partial [Salmonella enterica subsp. enterica serovar Infantis]|nr:hypothetical protein [Salmonella enterica]EDN1546546.1 hypothetical protein [Salmonella enterica subsp. enterica serovar Infantis]